MKKQKNPFMSPLAPKQAAPPPMPESSHMQQMPQIHIHMSAQPEPPHDDSMVNESDPDMDEDAPIKSLKQLSKLKNAMAMGKVKSKKKI